MQLVINSRSNSIDYFDDGYKESSEKVSCSDEISLHSYPAIKVSTIVGSYFGTEDDDMNIVSSNVWLYIKVTFEALHNVTDD